MPLKFPNARLFMHGLLTNDRQNVPEAIALGAYEFDLIGEEAVDEIAASVVTNLCPCMTAAREVIKTYCESRVLGSPNLSAEKIWSGLLENARRYREIGDARTSHHAIADGNHECNKFAPALLDLLLQEIRSHP